MNYNEVNLDLQSTVKRIYQNIIYRSSFYKMLNDSYIGELRNAGTPMIEVLKSQDVTVNVRQTKEIANQLTPSLMGYDSVKVDLTELPMDYSIRIPILVTGSGIANALDSALQKKDSAVAKAIDTYGFGKLENDNNITEKLWNPDTKEKYIDTINSLSADMFNNDVYDTYRLALSATEYGKYVDKTIVYDREYRLILGILRDVTEEETQRERKETIRRQTVEIADKVVDKQMRIVQEIASLLGETAAETKIALTKLKESISHE